MSLKRELRLVDIFAVASGAMISSGLFVLPGLAYARAGPAVIASYFLAGLLALTGMLSIAEVATAMPKAGGDYFFISRSLGSGVGTIAGLLSWMSLSLKSAFALIGMGAFARLLVALDIHLLAVLFCFSFVALNIIGVRHAGRTQVLLVAGLLVLMALYVVLGVPKVRLEYLSPFAPHGLTAVLSTTGFVFVSYGGLLKVASLAEETKDPGRNLPLGIILSLLVVSVFYTAMVFVTSGVVPPDRLGGSLTPISDGAAEFMGEGGRVVLSVAAVLAFVSTANAGLLAASRYLLALGRDGFVPTALARTLRKRRTPHIAIAVTGVFMIAALFLKLDVLVKAASTVLMLNFMLACLCIIILREGRVQNYRPLFRAPLYPWLQVAGIIGFGLLLFEMGLEALLVSAGFVIFAFLVYWRYGRVRASQEYALLHLIARITDKQLGGRSLEEELKAIIRERDNIVADRFDRLIERSPVLDLETGMSADTFFEEAAKALAPRVGLAAEVMRAKLIQREKESPTAISPTFAIPHVVIEGQRTFEILIARSREGIAFSESAPRVEAVFVLAGTIDERNFHLRALSAIAQIVQEPQFEERWLMARSEEDLRDLILLGKRRRVTPEAT